MISSSYARSSSLSTRFMGSAPGAVSTTMARAGTLCNSRSEKIIGLLDFQLSESSRRSLVEQCDLDLSVTSIIRLGTVL